VRSCDNSALQIGGRFTLSTRKVPPGAMLEQRQILRSLLKEGNKPLHILSRRQNVVGERAVKQTQVYCWISEIRRGREDLSDEERLGRRNAGSSDRIGPTYHNA
jgi:hypothetical protein